MQTIVDRIAGQRGGDGSLTLLDRDRPPQTGSWAALHDRARRLAAVLGAAGVGPGTRVALLAETSIELITTLQAVWLTGAAFVLLPPAASEATLRQCDRIVDDARPLLVGLGDGYTHLAHRFSARTVELSTLVAAASRVEPANPNRPGPADLAILQYTSGSTRDPRGVPVTHGHLAANLAAIRSATEHERIHGRVLSWLPLQHDLGLIGSLALPMSCGCSLVLQTTATFARRPASWLTAMSRYRITASTAPNFAYELMRRLLATGLEVDLSSVRFLLCGAEPIDAATMARFAAAARPYGLDPSTLVPAYGLAEATLAVTFSPLGSGVRVDRVDAAELESRGRAVPADDGRSLVRLGPPVAGTSLRIADPETGAPLPERRVGRVELCGPSVIGHYWGEAPPGPDAWLVTGDLGYLADGELVICGREKDVLFAAGRNLFAQDVEAAAAEVTGLRLGRVVAFGVGERFVVAVESRASEAASVRAAVSAAVLAEVGLAPAEVLTVPFGRLPKTTSGKLRRAETRRRHLAGELVPPERTVR